MQKLVEDFLIKNLGYLKTSPYKIAERLKIEFTEENIAGIKAIKKHINKTGFTPSETESYRTARSNALKTYNPLDGTKLSEKEEKELAIVSRFISEKIPMKDMDYVGGYKNFEPLTMYDINGQGDTVLVIGDIHEPFAKRGYLEFCIEQYRKFNCDRVVFIGDIIDNAFSSFHPTNPDGFGAGEELERAIAKIAPWVDAFPKASVLIGNHDRLAYRKAFAGGISKKWIREYNDVLDAPEWEFTEKMTIDDVDYSHGEAGTARGKVRETGRSRVQGHLHSQAYVEWINNRCFAVQVGCGIDDSEYAFAYAKDGKESILSCAVIDKGKQAILIKM
jgi:hypothetical protein